MSKCEHMTTIKRCTVATHRSIGLDCRIYNAEEQRIIEMKNSRGPFAADEQVVVVLSNLAVRVDKRGIGCAKKLIQACEPLVRVRGVVVAVVSVSIELAATAFNTAA